MKNRQVLSNALFAAFCMAGAVSAWALTSAPSDRKPAADAAKASRPAKTSRSSDSMTYTGCLRAENDGKTFVLTQVGGPDAPKTRNWKTGFITKKAGKLHLVAPGLNLRNQVGHTVQLTGRRADDTLRAYSVKVVGTTCN